MGYKCKATNTSGQACGAWATAGSDFCFTHDPARAAERSAARKLGGLNRRTQRGSGPQDAPAKVRTLTDVLTVLDLVLHDALALENSIARGRLLVAVCGEYTKAIQVGELESRLAALEEVLKVRAK